MKANVLLSLLAASLFAVAPALAQNSKPGAAKPATTSQPATDHSKDHKDHKDSKHDKDHKQDKTAAKAEVGKPAPDFKGTDSQGNTVNLSELTAKGKVVILQWFNPDCPFVVKHYNGDHKTFNDMASKYKGKDVVLIGIASSAPGKQGSGTDRINKARTDWGMMYPVVMDPSGEIGHAYDAKKTPGMVVIGKDGNIAYMGAIDDDSGAEKPGKTNYVTKAVDELLAGKPVTTASTPAYGCGVKY